MRSLPFKLLLLLFSVSIYGQEDSKETKQINHNGWSIFLPGNATVTWPFYTYYPYGSVRVPENIKNAQAVLAVPLTNDGEWVEVKFRVN